MKTTVKQHPELCLPPSASLRDAMRTMTRSRHGLIAVVAKDRTLLGLLADIDVRKALLNGVGLTASVTRAMNKRPITVAAGSAPERIAALFRRTQKTHIPVVDERGRLQGLAELMDYVSIPLHNPVFAGNEWRYVKQCLDTGWVSSAGAFVTRFERMAARRIGVAHAAATVNGTAALHLALLAAGVGPGDEVLTPSLTFIATPNSAVYLGAVPRFVDCERETFGMDPVKLERWLERETRRRGGKTISRSTGKRVAACVPTHIFGHPARIASIVAVCRRFAVPVIEDAAESLGSTYRGKATGSFGLAGCLSFNGNKIITTGGGGMVVTANAKIARTVSHLSTQAKKNSATYLHDAVGYNYRLPNLNAALGCAQMERLDVFLSRKRLVAQQYRKGLDGAAGLDLLWEPREARSNFWLNTVVASSKHRARALMARLNDHGFESRPLWTPCHRQPMFEPLLAGPIDVVDRLWETAINVPSSSDLSLKAVDRICALLRKS